MIKLTASEQRYIENAVFIAASRVLFQTLESIGTPTFRLGEVVDTTSGGTPSRSTPGFFGGEIPWVKSGELNDGLIESVDESITEAGLQNSSAKIFPAGTVVIALYGATVGKTGTLTFDAATNQAVCALFPKTPDLTRDYLFWFLRHKRQDFLDNSFGGAQPNISQKVLRDTLIPLPDVTLQHAIASYLTAIVQRKTDRSVSMPNLPDPLGNIPRIVARIDALASRIAEARTQTTDIDQDMARLLLSIYHQLIEGAPKLQMNQVAPLVRRPVEALPDATYHEIGIRSFGKGTFHKAPTTGLEIGTKRVFQIAPGDLVFSNVFAWEGAIAVARPNDEGRIGSHRFITCVPLPQVATSSFLCFHFLTEHGLRDIGEASPGGAGRNRTLNLDKLEKIQVPIPALDKQQWFGEIQSSVARLRSAQAESAAELDALLPSILDQAFKGEL